MVVTVKLSFRYVLSVGYAKCIIEDLSVLIPALSSAGWYNLLFFIDPATQVYRQTKAYNQNSQKVEEVTQYLRKEIYPDETTMRIVKEVCVDFRLGEIKVLMWNRMNAGYVFRRIYLPAKWQEVFSEAEIKGIIGHELGHQKMGSDRYVPLRLINRLGDELLNAMIPAHATGFFLALMAVITNNPSYFKWFSITCFYRLLHYVIENYFARKDEYKADQYGARLVGGQTMKRALMKIDEKARIEIFEHLERIPFPKKNYYRWLLGKEEGNLREWLLDHPFLTKRLQALAD